MIMEGKTTWQGFVRKRHFEARSVADVSDILGRLSSEGYTGKVHVNLSQGGFCGVDTEDSSSSGQYPLDTAATCGISSG